MKPSELFISELFEPFVGRVPGTAERLLTLRSLKADLSPLLIASDGDLTRLNSRGQGLLLTMRALVKEQVTANRKEQVWDARKTPWCQTHWEKLNPRSAKQAGISLLGRFLHRLKEHGLLPEGAEAFASLRVVCSPICCWLGDEEMEKLYAEPATEMADGAG